MDDRPRRAGGPPHLFLGLLIITLGVIFFLDQQGIFPAHEAFHFFWAAVVIFWGAQIVAHARSGSGHLWGAFVILMGAVFLANELGLLHIRIVALWPIGLIAFGLWTLLVANRRTRSEWQDWNDKVRSSVRSAATWQEWSEKPRDSTNSATAQNSSEKESQGAPGTDSEFSQTVVFSGFKRRITSQHFKYARVGAVLGSFTLDLTRADMVGDHAEIHVESVLGGGEIRIPDTWTVKLETGAIGGAFMDETYPRPADASAPAKRLIVSGTVVFGGVVIKN